MNTTEKIFAFVAICVAGLVLGLVCGGCGLMEESACQECWEPYSPIPRDGLHALVVVTAEKECEGMGLEVGDSYVVDVDGPLWYVETEEQGMFAHVFEDEGRSEIRERRVIPDGGCIVTTDYLFSGDSYSGVSYGDLRERIVCDSGESCSNVYGLRAD